MSTQTEPTRQEEKPVASQHQPPSVVSFRHVLRNRHFLLLWLAQLISLTILNAANFGVIVLVNEITHSVFMAGLAIIAFTLPAVPFSAVAGVIVDHINKRQVLWVSNMLRMGTMLLIVVSLLMNRSDLWPLYVLTFVTSLIGQFFTPAEGASIPLLVGERDLMPALSLVNISITLSQAIGFLLLGHLAATIFPPFTLHLGTLALHIHSIDMLFIIAAVFYVVCAILILCIPARAFEQEHIQKRERSNPRKNGAHIELSEALKTLWHDLVEGWHIVHTDRLLFFSVIQLSVVGIILLLIGELAGAFVQQILHRPAADMSIILAPAAIGLVGASILMPRITARVGKIRLTVIGFIVLAVGFVLLVGCPWLALHLDPQQGARSPLLFWITVVVVTVLGVAMASVNIPTQTMMQERAPEEGRARVLAFQFMLYNTGSIPVLLFAGVFAQFLGFGQLVLLLAVCILLFSWWGAWYVHGWDENDGGQNKAYERENDEEPTPTPV